VEHTYEYLVQKINLSNYFKDFYYNYYDKQNKEPTFEMDGVKYKFENYTGEKVLNQSPTKPLSSQNNQLTKKNSAMIDSQLTKKNSVMADTQINKKGSVMFDQQFNKKGSVMVDDSINILVPGTPSSVHTPSKQILLNRINSSTPTKFQSVSQLSQDASIGKSDNKDTNHPENSYNVSTPVSSYRR